LGSALIGSDEWLFSRTTFDTNTLEKVVRPHLHAKDPGYSHFLAVHEALKGGDLFGFVSETTITLEGIGRVQRGDVFGSTTLRRSTELVTEEQLNVTLSAEQVARQPLHPLQAERFVEAFNLGIRLLGAPRVAMPRVEGDFYAKENPSNLNERLDRFYKIMREIEARELGFPRASELANRWTGRGKPNDPWYTVLGTAKDIHETRLVARAIAEWSDADSIGAHYAYNNDVFCTLDMASGEAARGHAAILDANNRAWLSSTYGIKFATIEDVARHVRASTRTAVRGR
jgi:hypothetical protein